MHCSPRSSLLFLILVPFLVSGNQGSITTVQKLSTDDYNMRFVGGVDTRPYEFPWMVEMIISGIIVCEGILISNQWVLTAAKCFNINQGPNYIELTVGAYDFTVNSTMEPYRQVFNSTEFYASSSSYPSTSEAIGLVKLPKPVDLSAYIKPISLPRLCDPDPESVIVTGWGKETDCVDNSCIVLPSPVQMFNDSIVNVMKCNGTEESLSTFYRFWTSGNSSKMRADTGCPAQYVRPEDGNWVVLGVFPGYWIGYPSCIEKTEYFPYLRVQSSLKWIYNITGLPDPDANVAVCDLTTSSSTRSIQSPIPLAIMFLIALHNALHMIS